MIINGPVLGQPEVNQTSELLRSHTPSLTKPYLDCCCCCFGNGNTTLRRFSALEITTASACSGRLLSTLATTLARDNQKMKCPAQQLLLQLRSECNASHGRSSCATDLSSHLQQMGCGSGDTAYMLASNASALHSSPIAQPDAPESTGCRQGWYFLVKVHEAQILVESYITAAITANFLPATRKPKACSSKLLRVSVGAHSWCKHKLEMFGGSYVKQPLFSQGVKSHENLLFLWIRPFANTPWSRKGQRLLQDELARLEY